MCKKPRFVENTEESRDCFYPLEIQSQVGKSKDQELINIPGHVFLNLLVSPVSNITSNKYLLTTEHY